MELKDLLRKAAMSQSRLARKIGTSQQKVSRWINGSQPEYYYLPLLAEALEVSVEAVVRSFLWEDK